MPVPLGEKLELCGGGKGFFMHGKRLLSPTNYWEEVPGSGGKTPPHYPILPHVFQKRKK